MRILAVIAAIALTAPVLAASSDVPLPRERPHATVTMKVPLPRERPNPDVVAAASSASSPVEAPTPAPPPPASSSSLPSPQAASSSEPPGSSASSSAEPGTSLQVTPPKPPRDYQVACPALMEGKVTGKVAPPIHDGQCGIQSPLALTAVTANGRSIPLNETITTDCGMASALPDWIGEMDSYVQAHDKTRIKTVNFSTSYDCRNVDHEATGNLSFHAFADALDLMGLTLEDGRTISIDPGFRGTPEEGSEILHFARDSACTHFMTVLSPDADAEHQNNMHVDLACHGKMCTARLCE